MMWLSEEEMISRVIERYLLYRIRYAQNAQNRLLSDHIKPLPPLPKGSELRKYLRPYIFQPCQTPAIAAPNIRRRVKDQNQLAPDFGGICLSRGASAAERRAEATETEMMLPKGMPVASDNSEDEDTQQKKAYSCASVTSPVMADMPINGFVGIEMSFNVKQSLHSSPVDIKTKQQIKSV
jgi:hypothetical protein